MQKNGLSKMINLRMKKDAKVAIIIRFWNSLAFAKTSPIAQKSAKRKMSIIILINVKKLTQTRNYWNI